MKRVLIIGCPGSGKSTLARALHEITGIPLCHLDLLYWNADRTTVSREVFDRRLQEILATDAWIIDGNYQRTMELRIRASDTVLFLDYGTDVCLSGIHARLGRPRADLPWVEDTVDGALLSALQRFSEDCRPHILQLLQRYPEKEILSFSTRAQADAWLAEQRKKAAQAAI